MSCSSTIWLNYDLLEDRCTDVTINNILLFYHITQIHSMLLWVWAEIHHRRCQNMFGTSLKHSVAPHVLLFFGFTKFWPHLWTDTLNKALICQWTGLYELVLRPMRCFSFCFPCREMQITPCGGLILFSLCTQCFNKFENAKMMRYMYITCVKLIVTVELTFAPSLSNTLLSLTYEHKPNICQKKIQQLSWVKKI